MYVAQPGRFLKEKALARRMQDPLYYAMVMQAVEDVYKRQLQKLFLGIGICSGILLFFLRIPVLSLYDLQPLSLIHILSDERASVPCSR